MPPRLRSSALHLLSAFALAGSIVLFSYLIVRSRNVDTPDPRSRWPRGRCGEQGRHRVGGIGTLVFGIWLASGSTTAGLGAAGSSPRSSSGSSPRATGQRAGVEYRASAERRPRSSNLPGQTGAERGAPRAEPVVARADTAPGRDARRLPDPDRHDLEARSQTTSSAFRPDSWKLPLLIHITGAMILVGGMLGAAAASRWGAATWARSSSGTTRSSFVAFPGLVLTKIGATRIWSKESAHSLIGAAFRTRRSSLDRGLGGTALDGGAGLLVLALILGWFGLRRYGGQ